MNVYDFDRTIFQPDSSFSFFMYCLRQYPRQVLKAAVPSLIQAVNYLYKGKKDAKILKEALFSYLNRIDDIDSVVDAFWEKHFYQIAEWYLAQRKDDDLIISASPEFLLKPVAEKLHVNLIATRMNPYTGKISGKNCHDIEKCRRFKERFSTEEIDEFYSDSLSDTPMAEIARKAYLVIKLERSDWPDL